MWKLDCKHSVNTLILKKYLHVSTGFIALAQSSDVMKFLHFLERLHGKMEFKFTRPELRMQIVTIAGKETEKNKSSFFFLWVSNSAIMPGKDLGYTLEIGMHRNSIT